MTVWILDDWPRAGKADFQQALANQTSFPNLNPPPRLTVNPVTTWPHINAARGDAVVVFASSTSHVPSIPPRWLSSCALIPVVEKADDLSNHPAWFRARHAFVRDRYHASHWSAVLADDVLSRVTLTRQTRSVFISYVHAEGNGAARQLTERLSHDGFEVFLDDRSLRPGELFGPEIFYRLNDADMIIVLATPGLTPSRWVQKEITAASNSHVALLVVDLGETAGTHPVVRQVMSDSRFRPDFRVPWTSTDELDVDDLENLVATIYRLRVGGIMRRVQNLLPAVARRLSGSYQPGKQLGELEVTNPQTNTTGLVCVLPFRPPPTRCGRSAATIHGSTGSRSLTWRIAHAIHAFVGFTGRFVLTVRRWS